MSSVAPAGAAASRASSAAPAVAHMSTVASQLEAATLAVDEVGYQSLRIVVLYLYRG